MSIKAKLENNILKIEVPFKDVGLSKSGKTRVLATTHGLFTTEIKYRGAPVILVLSAFAYLTGGKNKSPEKKTLAPAKRNAAENSGVLA